MKKEEIKYRLATLADAPAIAKLHIQNWQTSYRGSWSDNFLDNIAPQKQLKVWTERLSTPNKNQHIILAETCPEFTSGAENQLIGFACTKLNTDTVYGSLLDNLHVNANWRGHKIGKQLTLVSMDWVRSQNPESGYYLWVLEDNHHARKFYKKLGGKEVETVIDEGSEIGTYSVIRCYWKKI